jgi:hypothetical protein
MPIPFDATYDPRDLLVQAYIDPGGGAFENFAADTIEGLHDQGVEYSEQSVSLNKLKNRFGEDTMRAVHERLAAMGKDAKMRFLAMLATSKTLGADGSVTDAEFLATLDALRPALERGDVAGIDIAGPEGPFTKEGMERLRQLYTLTAEVGKSDGRARVLRPHVGEGYAAGQKGKHVEIARKNLDMVLDTLEDLGYRGPQSGVIVRFGHAAFATPEQLQRMAKLGVIAETLVGSNLATGTIATPSEHPLLYNLYYGTKTMLSTDGHGVMNTTLPIEYQRAATQIEAFRDGKISLRINGEVVQFTDLPQDIQQRFSIDTLTVWSKEYDADASVDSP